jgi:hypothetical protein
LTASAASPVSAGFDDDRGGGVPGVYLRPPSARRPAATQLAAVGLGGQPTV